MTVFGRYHLCHPGRGASRSDALLIRDPHEVLRFKVLKVVSDPIGGALQGRAGSPRSQEESARLLRIHPDEDIAQREYCPKGRAWGA
jgi:hypothetical protein